MNLQRSKSKNSCAFTRLYPEMGIRPNENLMASIQGWFVFSTKHNGQRVDDRYKIRVEIANSISDIPRVFEIGERIPSDFHKLDDGSLCLGSPLQLKILAGRNFTLTNFVHKCVVPYLHSYSMFESGNELPFGELRHGWDGIIDDYKRIFQVTSEEMVREMFLLASYTRSKANRHPCPCGSGLRVGKCHNMILNQLRQQVGRLWFRDFSPFN